MRNEIITKSSRWNWISYRSTDCHCRNYIDWIELNWGLNLNRKNRYWLFVIGYWAGNLLPIYQYTACPPLAGEAKYTNIPISLLKFDLFANIDILLWSDFLYYNYAYHG